VLFCRIHDCDENQAVHQSEMYCKIKKTVGTEEAIDLLEDTHFTENEKKQE
jgi:hypothetical protein